MPACPTHQRWRGNGRCHCRIPPNPLCTRTRASIHSARPLAKPSGATPNASCSACLAASAMAPPAYAA
eukprot:11181931-Lingulodinium_polyedra.AAC.1